MNERPILFSGPMVRAILDGEKTQTRRVVKFAKPAYADPQWMTQRDLAYATSAEVVFRGCVPIRNPYGLPGDLLWVRESWQAQNTSGQWWHEVPHMDRPLWNWAWTNPVEPAYDVTPPRWLAGIHMPKAATRITLEITGIRVERVQAISEADAIAEGTQLPVEYFSFPIQAAWTEREVYRQLWDHLNASRGYAWESNPWVWVIEFRPVSPGGPVTPA